MISRYILVSTSALTVHTWNLESGPRSSIFFFILHRCTDSGLHSIQLMTGTHTFKVSLIFNFTFQFILTLNFTFSLHFTSLNSSVSCNRTQVQASTVYNKTLQTIKKWLIVLMIFIQSVTLVNRSTFLFLFTSEV